MATNSKDIKALMAARRQGLQPGVPQTDPVAAALAAAPPAPLPPVPVPADAPPLPLETVQPLPPAPAAEVAAPPAPAVAPPLITLSEVDRSQQLRVASFHMYPSRHKQLKEMAFLEDRKPWQVVDDALALYAKKHYPGGVRRGPAA